MVRGKKLVEIVSGGFGEQEVFFLLGSNNKPNGGPISSPRPIGEPKIILVNSQTGRPLPGELEDNSILKANAYSLGPVAQISPTSRYAVRPIQYHRIEGDKK